MAGRRVPVPSKAAVSGAVVAPFGWKAAGPSGALIVAAIVAIMLVVAVLVYRLCNRAFTSHGTFTARFGRVSVRADGQTPPKPRGKK